MRRGRVVLKKIEDKITRRVTFSKRKSGLLKKAEELSVLCDVDMAVLVFSNSGELFKFGSPSVHETIERYQQLCYNSGLTSNPDDYRKVEEVLRLRAEYESLQRSVSHFCGEELESLTLKQLGKLEKVLERTLSRTRKLEAEIMLKNIADLTKKNNDQREENIRLVSQLFERVEEFMLENDDDLGDINLNSRFFDSILEEADDSSPGEGDDGSRE